MPKFSIIIPGYNVEPYIDRCLESIFNQTNQDFEIIFINDGSTDKTLEVVNKYKDEALTHEERHKYLVRTRDFYNKLNIYVIQKE